MNNYLQRSGSSGKLSDNGALMGHFTLSGGGGMFLNTSCFNILFLRYVFSILLFLFVVNSTFSSIYILVVLEDFYIYIYMPYFLFYFSTSKCYINFMHVSLGIKIEFSNFWLFSKKYLFHKKKN